MSEGSYKKIENIPRYIKARRVQKMDKAIPDKEKLLSMLTDIYDQLEDLELVLEASFSDLRNKLNDEELSKISKSENRLSNIEKNLERTNVHSGEHEAPNQVARKLKLEMGF
jgi:VIT1/CCC1 family predicted Fe2+/Mn2+ transporter